MKKLLLGIIIITLSASQSFSKIKRIKGELDWRSEVEPKECWRAMEKGKFIGKAIMESNSRQGGDFIYLGSYFTVSFFYEGKSKYSFFCSKYTPKF